MGSTERARILVAEDEANLRKVLAVMLRREGYDVVEARDGLEAMGLLDASLAAVITDLRMPQKDGMSLLRHAVAEHPELPVILITAHGSVDSAVEAVKLGAFDYIEKPFEHSQIRAVVDKAVRTRALAAGEQRADGTGPGRHGLIGRSPQFEQIFSVLDRVADTPSTVLITGESGTGKELVARALHQGSSRRTGPFIKINCAAIPKSLMESELFGYDKGAFTGAVSSKPGRFELADGGTLFLDEIGEIPIDMQVKLLRVLQESEFERVGGVKTLKVDVRLVAATNRDLQREVQAGAFREDLFYRLNVVPIWLPPLRERKQDIPLLARHFLQKSAKELGVEPKRLSDAAMKYLASCDFAGNVRQLENVCHWLTVMAPGQNVEVIDLPPELRTDAETGATTVAGDWVTALENEVERQLARGDVGIIDELTSQFERALIQKALAHTGGRRIEAATLLGWGRNTLTRKIQELGMESPNHVG